MSFKCSFELGDKTAYSEGGWTFTGATSISNAWAHQTLHAYASESQWSLAFAGSVNEDWVLSPGLGTDKRHAQWAWNMLGIADSEHVVAEFMRMGSVQMKFTLNSDNYIRAYRNTTLVATSATPMDGAGVYWTEVELVAADSGGTFAIKLNGEEFINYAGDTQSSTTADWDQIRWRMSYGAWGYIDNIIITTDAEGPVVFGTEGCQVLRPASDVSVVMAPSTPGDNYPMVAEVPAVKTSYVEADATDEADRYGTGPALESMSTIHGVAVYATMARDSGITQGRVGIYSNGTIDYGSYEALAASPDWRTVYSDFDVDPDTGVAWDDGGLGGLQVIGQFN